MAFACVLKVLFFAWVDDLLSGWPSRVYDIHFVYFASTFYLLPFTKHDTTAHNIIIIAHVFFFHGDKRLTILQKTKINKAVFTIPLLHIFTAIFTGLNTMQ